jgi:hypothetical protein
VATCDSLTNVLSGLGSLLGLLPAAPLWPTLAYASEVDAMHWHTGCRDGGFAVGQLGIDCLRPGLTGSGASGICLGAWGFLKPRQMRDIGLDPGCFSAKTAVRAMSLARTSLGTFPYPVPESGHLQQVYPVRSRCFDIGQRPLPMSPPDAQGTAVSRDGRYAWVYWVPARCCARNVAVAACGLTNHP